MKTESVYPEHREECARDEVLVLIDDYIHWYNHARIKRSFGWMSPVECRQKPRKGCVTVSKKTSAALFSIPNVAASSTTRGSANRSACSASNAPLVQGQFLWQRGGRVHVCFGKLPPRHPSARTSIASLSSIMGCAKRRLFRYISGRFMRESA